MMMVMVLTFTVMFQINVLNFILFISFFVYMRLKRFLLGVTSLSNVNSVFPLLNVVSVCASQCLYARGFAYVCVCACVCTHVHAVQHALVYKTSRQEC